ncbi:polysaccharide deacetylase family protein [Marininema halotolerans]|uniref:Polysaccharide deacetylase family sporulation protein PdaB n=1 Tax=Marininema halotolerans TaxID=1155944 RepID=A0A1I6U4N2_9BACL|nr:polysaccharide deacetylase family protein [Marininema halotolerans]SFS96395.1 polysaccharide deacetylase family sporulation protein PdaB [Marininema halotolerans]
MGKRHIWAMGIGCFILIFTMVANAQGDGHKKTRRYYEERGEIVWEAPKAGKKIALTFDDGPHPVHTPRLLKTLKKHHVKATFFVVGKNVEKHPQLTRQIRKEGHEIANHTYSHPRVNRLTLKKLEEEIEKGKKAVYETTGKKTNLVRTPGGYYNDMVIKATKETKHQLILWSWDQDTNDWQRRSTHRIVRQVISGASNGDIVLFHDSEPRAAIALNYIIPTLKKRGYQFVSVSELMKEEATKNKKKKKRFKFLPKVTDQEKKANSSNG